MFLNKQFVVAKHSVKVLYKQNKTKTIWEPPSKIYTTVYHFSASSVNILICYTSEKKVKVTTKMTGFQDAIKTVIRSRISWLWHKPQWFKGLVRLTSANHDKWHDFQSYCSLFSKVLAQLLNWEWFLAWYSRNNYPAVFICAEILQQQY